MNGPENFNFSGLLFYAAGFLLSVFLFGFITLFPFWDRFVVEEIRTGKIIYCGKPAPELEFALSYTHSVNKSVITDYFSVGSDGAIILRASEFSSFGAGVTAGPEDKGAFSESAGRIRYIGIDRVLFDFRLFAGTESDHRFHSPDDTFRLLERTAPRTGLRFRVRKTASAEIILYLLMRGVLHG
jgi:hypothetical protein